MKILAIETSCDETALSIVEGTLVKGNNGLEKPEFFVLNTALYSQAALHSSYGGVFPNLAKREHALNILPLLEKLLSDMSTNNSNSNKTVLSLEKRQKISLVLSREPQLLAELLTFIENRPRPDIDFLSVTRGPGLELALWVGITFTQALAVAWDMPIVPVNHMEGHITSVLSSADTEVGFPALALLISGGHTEIVLIKKWGDYEVIGQTVDDAVGEAFDKVARMLGLAYPGGPEVSKRAGAFRASRKTRSISLPRPMLRSKDLNFSFSGLKTSVKYLLEKIPVLTEDTVNEICAEFEDSVIEVLYTKTKKALSETDAVSLIVGGGVIANSMIREKLNTLSREFGSLKVYVPEMNLTTDNATMIAFAAYVQYLINPKILGNNPLEIKANGNERLSSL